MTARARPADCWRRRRNALPEGTPVVASRGGDISPNPQMGLGFGLGSGPGSGCA